MKVSVIFLQFILSGLNYHLEGYGVWFVELRRHQQGVVTQAFDREVVDLVARQPESLSKMSPSRSII